MKNIYKINTGDDQIISFDDLKHAKKYFKTQIKKFKKLNKTHPIKKEVIMYADNYIIDYWRVN